MNTNDNNVLAFPTTINVGDEVRIIGNDYSEEYYSVGETGAVRHIDEDGDLYVYFYGQDDHWYVSQADAEVISKAPQGLDS